MSNITEARKAQVPEQLDRLTNEVNELEKIVDMLRERLQPVLRNDPSDDSMTKKDEGSLVDVANGIRVSANRVSDVIGNIGSIVELLEV